MTLSLVTSLNQDREAIRRRHAVAATIVILLGSVVLLFARLGHYELWDDEAITAMTARSVWRTGDTDARVDDHNILGYRNGLLLKGFKDRYTPPFQFYLLAPFVGLFGTSALVCRLPFALFGLIGVIVMLRWLWRIKPSPLLAWAAAIAILTNHEYFLFARQCRYYALATTFTILVGYFYVFRDGRRNRTVALSVVLALLLASQYLNYAAAILCLAVDYALWGRQSRRFDWRDWLILILPQIVVGAVVCSVWNPLARGVTPGGAAHVGILQAKLWSLQWNWRDMLFSGFGIVAAMVMCPVTYLIHRNRWTVRAPLALVLMGCFIAILMTSPDRPDGSGEIRYLAPLTPLCIALTILVVHEIQTLRLRAAVLAALLIALLIEPIVDRKGPVYRPGFYLFARELWSPPTDPYTHAAAWINQNIPAGKSIWVQVDYMTSPLMLRAGKAIYAWQFNDPPKPEYVSLPDIHFKYRTAPDYMIAFGPWKKEVIEAQDVLAERGWHYEPLDTIHTYWKDVFRAEVVWREFFEHKPRPGEEIYIYRRIN